jgi:hypothetical protein
MITAFLPGRPWISAVAALVASGVVFSAGMKAQHWREAEARSVLKDDIIALQAEAVAREGARAEAAETHAETTRQLAASAMDNFTRFLDAAGQSDSALAAFLEELNHDDAETGRPDCGYDDDRDRERWLRLFPPGGTGDGLRDGDGGDRPGDTGQGP